MKLALRVPMEHRLCTTVKIIGATGSLHNMQIAHEQHHRPDLPLKKF